MGRKLYYLVGIVVVLFGWHKYRESQRLAMEDIEPDRAVGPGDAVEASWQCDGRVYCSQMPSCAEATWFLQHCPGMKMDGDQNGVPCEKQWCR